MGEHSIESTRHADDNPDSGKPSTKAIASAIRMKGSSFNPRTLFNVGNATPPRVLVSPGRYIQGPGVIDQVGRFLECIGVRRAGVLASRRGHSAEGAAVTDSLAARSMTSIAAVFDGECSLAEIDKHAAALAEENLDCLIGVGGGKPVDAAKCIAYRLGVPVVIVPTLASNDAPCSALSVIYAPDGVNEAVEYFPQNPIMVIVDTDVVARASERYLVAGMGDAMATCYEARVVFNNPAARTPAGGRPTLASCALSETCATILYEQGEAAAADVAAGQTGTAVEAVVEANTLLSGLGFESGGLALAHGMALAYTHIDVVHDNYLHGEMVAMGMMAQLALEQSGDLRKAALFFARVGLPIHLGQLSLSSSQHAALDTLIQGTLASPIAHHMSAVLDEGVLNQAIIDADALGRAVSGEVGDAAFRRLQAL